jgi:hypothetical protein
MHAETLSSSCLSADNTVFLSRPLLQETVSFYPRLLSRGQSVMRFLPFRRIHIHHISSTVLQHLQNTWSLNPFSMAQCVFICRSNCLFKLIIIELIILLVIFLRTLTIVHYMLKLLHITLCAYCRLQISFYVERSYTVEHSNTFNINNRVTATYTSVVYCPLPSVCYIHGFMLRSTQVF